jgi:1-acyl-sn-glycerol-3-phosphate acyltransferase
LTPAVFVAKREVKNWPVFGWFAKLAGTVFVDRRRRSQVGASATLIKALLSEDALVVLFPEGTSSDGQNSAVRARCELQASCLGKRD